MIKCIIEWKSSNGLFLLRHLSATAPYIQQSCGGGSA